MLEDGSYKLLDSMSQRDENWHTGIMNYTMKEGPFFYWDNEYNIMAPEVQNIYTVWLSVDYSDALYESLPTLCLNEQENSVVANAMTDIETYVLTQTLLWMTNQKELNDDTWAEYVAGVENYGLDGALEAYSSAYARFLNR